MLKLTFLKIYILASEFESTSFYLRRTFQNETRCFLGPNLESPNMPRRLLIKTHLRSQTYRFSKLAARLSVSRVPPSALYMKKEKKSKSNLIYFFCHIRNCPETAQNATNSDTSRLSNSQF